MDSTNPTLRLRVYVGLTAVGAMAALLLGAWETAFHWHERVVNGFIAILAVALAAEISSIRVQVGTSTVSIAFIPLLAGAVLFEPILAMTLGGITQLVVEVFVRRKPSIKVIFNTSKEILALGFASGCYQLLGGVPSVTDFPAPPAAVAAGIGYAALTSTAVSLAVSVAERLEFSRAWARIFGGSILYDLFATPFPPLLAYLYVRWELGGVVALSVPLFVIRHVYVQNLRLEQASRELLELMVKNIEARDPYTSGHSQRVAEYARILAKEAGVGSRHVEQIYTAALLHDVGKVYNEYAPLLQKEGLLSPEEKRLLQTHPTKSAELIRTISSLKGYVEEAVRHHHENFDGSGYPDGFAGESIPIGARVIMIADTIDAMTTDRPYRRALPFERVVEELRHYSGTQFDPRLADLAIRSPSVRRLVGDVTSDRPSQEAQVGRSLERAAV